MTFDILLKNLRIEDDELELSWRGIDLLARSAVAEMSITVTGKEYDFGVVAPLTCLSEMAGAIHECDLFPQTSSQKFSLPHTAREWRLKKVDDLYEYELSGPFLGMPIIVHEREFRRSVYRALSQIATAYTRRTSGKTPKCSH